MLQGRYSTCYIAVVMRFIDFSFFCLKFQTDFRKKHLYPTHLSTDRIDMATSLELRSETKPMASSAVKKTPSLGEVDFTIEWFMMVYAKPFIIDHCFFGKFL